MTVFGAVGAVIVVVTDVKTLEIGEMFGMNSFNQLFGGDALFFCCQHNGRAMSIIRTNIVTSMAAHFLKAYPNIGLDVFNHVAKVNRTIGIGKGAGDQNFALCHGVTVSNTVRSQNASIPQPRPRPVMLVRMNKS